MILSDLLGIPKDKLKDETLRIVFAIVTGFLILIIVQSVKTNISQCPIYKSEGNICLEQMDFVNKNIFGNLFSQPIFTFIFVLGLNLVLTFFIFEIFKECIPKKMNFNKFKGSGLILTNNNDYITGCPFGFGKKKKIDKDCNFINETDLKNEEKTNTEDINVSVKSNIDLNNCSEKETNILKEVLDGVLPGIYPKVVDVFKQEKNNENMKKNIKDLKKERKETIEQTKEFGNKLNDVIEGLKKIYKNKDVINIDTLNLENLLN